MSQGLFSIGGIASGLDTDAMIQELLRVEARPVERLAQQQDDLTVTRDAWGEVNTKLSSLRTAIDAVARPDRFEELVSVTSSNEAAVTVTADGAPAEEELTFSVEELATAMQRSSADTFTSRDSEIGERTLELTVNGVTHDITADLAPDATLDDLVAAVNDAETGVSARALAVGSDAFQLVLSADDTGEGSAFDVDAAGWQEPFAVTQQAGDAVLDVSGITVTRSSNTIDDLLDGATIQLHQATAGPVTVGSTRDVDAAVGAVTDLVSSLNATLTKLDELTDYDPETREAGPLQGEQAASALGFTLRSAVSRPVEGLEGLAALASSLGIELDRHGGVEVDEAALRAAFTEDWEATTATLSRAGSSDAEEVRAVSGAARTVAGTYEVEIDQAAEIAQVVGAAGYTPPEGDPKSFRVSRPDGTDVVVMISSEATTVGTAVSKINQQLRAAGEEDLIAEEVVDGDGNARIAVSEQRYGSAYEFEIMGLDENGDDDPEAGVWGLATHGFVAGRDVQGTIDGATAVGSGTRLTAVDGDADGLNVFVEASAQPPSNFEVTFSHGVAGSVSAALATAEGVGGTVARAQATLDSQIRLYQDRIEAFDDRLAAREETLRRQFVGLESAMHRAQEQSAWLTQNLAALNG